MKRGSQRATSFCCIFKHWYTAREKGKNSMKNKKNRAGLFIKLIELSLIPLILSTAMISTISLFVTKSNLEKNAENTLYIVANNLANYCYQNEINAVNVGNYYEYLDSLKEKNIEMAILLEGTPSATSIKNINEYRIREIEVKKDIVADKEEIQNGYYDKEVIIDDKAYFAYYMPIRDKGEIIGLAFAGELQVNVTGAIKNIVVLFLSIALCLVVIFAVITLLFSKGLLKSFKAVGAGVTALSKGDLSKQKERESSVKEMNTLLLETGIMQKNMSETIGKVKTVSAKLAEIIEDVTRLSNSSAERANQSASSMDELSAAAVEMAENVLDIHTQMLEIGSCVNDISENVERLFESSGNILRTNNEAKIEINDIMEHSKESVYAVNDIAKQIKQTNDSITEIDTAVELIISISEQTKLLSLNATIEAARAGDQGKGFAVVAEEIRSLSEKSSEGAEMIKNIAQTIMEQSHESVKLADNVSTLILKEQEGVSKTREKYEELSKDIEQSVKDISAIAEKTDHLTNYKEKVLENVQELSGISEENMASNEEINSNISEILSEVQIVSENCKEMNHMAKELEESVSYFHNG